jgi:hypothetical protein
MKVFKLIGLAALACLLIVSGTPLSGLSSDPKAPGMSIDQLKAALGDKDLVIVDARLPKDWDKGKTKIIGATRVERKDIPGWAKKLKKDQRIVLYCS